MKSKVVFLTGGTGTMGLQTIKTLLERAPKFQVRAIARDSAKNREIFKEIQSPYLDVIWGDMNDYNTILKCVTGADYVLHIGAMVSPMADDYPEDTLKTNIGSTLKIIKAIKEQPDPDAVRLVYVGTVAMTGNRTAPIHMGRVGDPLNPSIFDYYALSKVFSERAVFESGLKHWVSIRQTGQFPSNENAASDPIGFHQPPNNVLEYCVYLESATCMANICEEEMDKSFWRNAYNLSSGKEWRWASWEYYNVMLEPLGLKFEDVYDTTEFARFNFHGQYYLDSDVLEDYLHFRFVNKDEFFANYMATRKAALQNLEKPSAEDLRAMNVQLTQKRRGIQWMFDHHEEDWIKAFFGSEEEKGKIKSLKEGYELYKYDENATHIDHGYDEGKAIEELSLQDVKQAAKFRGGECLAESMEDGQIFKPLRFRCAHGHVFELTPNAMLRGGHWCNECHKDEWHYGELAESNPFYAQIWNAHHKGEEKFSVKMEVSAYDITNQLKEELGL